MKKSMHTPGPWKACLNVPTAIIPGHIIKVDDKVMRPIASLWKGGGKNGESVQVANAHLIAAAPDMYKLLKVMIAHSDRRQAAGFARSDEGEIHYKNAMAVCAKAEGRV